MIARTRKIDLDEAIVGMVLSADVPDGRGGMLLPAQTVLTQALLASLQRRGIDTVCIAQEGMSQDELDAEHERVQLRLSHLFRKCGSHPAGALLLHQITQYRRGEIK
ncbi:MAG: hypothetical protein ABWY05_12580 [Noviherbaspirillum sp.]